MHVVLGMDSKISEKFVVVVQAFFPCVIFLRVPLLEKKALHLLNLVVLYFFELLLFVGIEECLTLCMWCPLPSVRLAYKIKLRELWVRGIWLEN